jgi:TPR repeat protein
MVTYILFIFLIRIFILTMLRRASRGVVYLTKSRTKNLCENVLSEERFHAMYPPPTDPIAQKAEARAQYQAAVKLLLVAAKNHPTSTSEELTDITLWTVKDVESGNLTTDQLMRLAKLRFNGTPSGFESQRTQSQTAGSAQSQSGSELESDRRGRSDKEISQDPELAMQAWIQASKRGNTDASYSVAFCLLNGIGIEKDEEEAFALMFPLANSYNNAYAHVSASFFPCFPVL